METLSDKRLGCGTLRNYLEDDVKEFIRELKDILTMDGFGYDDSKAADKIIKRDIIRTIDKLAGDKLI